MKRTRISRNFLCFQLFLGVVVAGACRKQSSAPRQPTTAKVPAAQKKAPPEVPSVPVLRALRVGDAAIKVDGRLDDQAWTRASSTGPFVKSPDGKPNPRSPVNAEAKVAWDADHLYFAFRVHDKNPMSPFSPTDEDPHVWEHSSAVELMIQPGDPKNNKHYYEIQVDTAGAIWDTRFDDYNKPITGGPDPKTKRYGHQSWKSGLKKGIVIDKKAGNYTVELAIPFSSLPSPQASVPPKPGDTWRINLYTFRDGQRETMSWSPILRQGNFHKSSRFGRVTFATVSR
jgi:hypothetical protein